MLTDEDFAKLSNPSYDLEGNKFKLKNNIKDAYRTLIDILHKYCDLEERYYPVIALWIIGTYTHDEFETFPYLFLNAAKGSGKSRLLRLISHMAKNGKLLGSMTESALFRGSKGNTLCIDEFEHIGSDEKMSLRELLNSAYKRGLVIERYRKKKALDGEIYEVETFDVYTSIAMANISGMERVLEDRCITLILEKSSNEKITRLIEAYNSDFTINEIKKLLINMQKELCTLIRNTNVSKDWNEHVLGNDKIFFNESEEIKEIQRLQDFFKMIDDTQIEGRNLELLLPLYFIAYLIDDEQEALNTILKISKELIREKEEDDLMENSDKLLRKFLVDKIKNDNLEYLDYISTSKISNQFKEFLGDDNEWLNPRWTGKALKRLKLVKGKKRETNGIKVLIDFEKLKIK